MIPFVFLAPGLLWTSQQLFFIVLPLIIIAFYIRNIWVKTFLLYVMAWQILLFLLYFNNPNANPGNGLNVIITLMSGAIIFKFVSEGSLKTSKWFWVIRIAVILQILLAIPQFWKFSPLFYVLSHFTKMVNELPSHLTGTIGNRNYFAAFVAISVPMFIGWATFKIKEINVNLSLIGIFIILYFCFSPGTIAAVIAMSFLLAYRVPKGKIRWAVMSAGPILAVAYTGYYVLSTGYHVRDFVNLPLQLKELIQGKTINYFEPDGDLGRFGMWIMAFTQLKESWIKMIFGLGPGAPWGRAYPLHSEYMSVWFQFGLVGLALMIGYIWTTVRFLFKSKNMIFLAAAIIICLEMVMNHTMEVPVSGFLVIIIAALIEREKHALSNAR
jgi:hypothetical protein